MRHIKEELDHFLEFLKEIEEVTGQMPMVILESTGHSHSPVIQYLEEQGIPYILLNPTDAIDAYQLCVLYYKEDFEPHKIRGIQLLDLRNLSRQQEIVTNMYVEAKLQFHTILDQVFPEYRKNIPLQRRY